MHVSVSALVSAVAIAAALAWPTAASAQLLLEGTEFQVNSYTTGYQDRPAVARGADGGFVIVWTDEGGPGYNNYSVFGQRFDATGVKVGTQFSVFDGVVDGNAAIAADSAGRFVVVWQGPDASDYGVFARRFDSDATPLGATFQVNSHTTGYQGGDRDRGLSVAAADDGSFVVVWESEDDQDGDFTGIFGQRYDSAGGTVGTEFQVNSYTTYFQRYPQVSADADGDFVVVWWSSYNPIGGAGQDVFGQRFSGTTGLPDGAEFQVNSGEAGSYRQGPDVASAVDGSFVVVWVGDVGGYTRGVLGRKFDATGAPDGTEFVISTTDFEGYYYARPVVASSGTSSFVVAWVSESDSSGDYDRLIAGRSLGSGGAPLGDPFRVNTYTSSSQRRPAVAPTAGGGFVVVWDGSYGIGAGYGAGGYYNVFGQRVVQDGPTPTTSTTSTTLPGGPATKDQQKCVTSMNKAGAKLSKAQGKENSGCLKDASKGFGGNAELCLTADGKGKISKAEAKTAATESKLCTPPTPNFGFAGAATVNTLDTERIIMMGRLFGGDFNGAVVNASSDKAGAKCQALIEKSVEKATDARLKAFNKCQSSGMKAETIQSNAGLEACTAGLAGDSKVSKADAKIASSRTKKCEGVDLSIAFPGGCGSKTGSAFDECVKQLVDCTACRTLNTMDGLSVDCDLLDDASANGSCGGSLTLLAPWMH